MHRGKQYIRAIQLYYRKFNAYPPTIDALVKTNEIRFLRKRYIDPMTGKDDWKTIGYCQNKAPIAMGFFGQPLGPASGCGPLAGTGPSGGNGINGGGLFPNQPGVGTAAGISPTSPGSPTQPTPGVGTTSNDPNAPQTNPTSPTGTTGTDSNGSQSGGILGDSNNGQTFGGGGIMGVSPASDKKSLLIYKKKDHYNQWEFTYSKLMDQMTMQGGNAGTIGQPVGGAGGGINGGGINGGGGIINGGGGGINGGATTPITPPQPTQPTQPTQPPQQ
jgi:hypothetical protein